MEDINESKPWYKKWWGILLIILFFPILIPYLVWTKTGWNKWIKIGITTMCVLILVFGFAGNSQNKKQAFALVSQAETYINENKINEAQDAINKSMQLNPNKDDNRAFSINDNMKLLQSDDFLKRTLAEMSNEDFEILKKNQLKKSYISHEGLNNIFLKKLYDNRDNRAIYIAEVQKKNQEESDQQRKKLIEQQFSPWDGSHVKLTQVIKESMNNPKSYEHVKTVYIDMKDYIIVTTTFRGTNAFDAVVTNTVKAKVSIDGENIQILEQY